MAQSPPDRMVHVEASWRVKRVPQHMHCVSRSCAWLGACKALPHSCMQLQPAHAGLGGGSHLDVLARLSARSCKCAGLGNAFPKMLLRYSVLRAAPSCHPNGLFSAAHISFSHIQHAGSHRSSLRAARGRSAMQRRGAGGPRAGRQCDSCSTLLGMQGASRIDQNAPARQRLLLGPPHRLPPPVRRAAAGPTPTLSLLLPPTAGVRRNAQDRDP